jgi:hypothetical protein
MRIIGGVEIKSECAFCDSVLRSPRMESLRALRRTQFLKHSRSKIDHYLGERWKDTRNRALRRVTGQDRVEPEKCLALITIVVEQPVHGTRYTIHGTS